MNTSVKKWVTLSMLGAMAYLVMLFIRVPVILFLKYEPKDVIITIGGFLFGPLSALAVTVVVAFVEMITVSDTGLIGLVMNILASAAFACTAAFIYKRVRSLTGAIIGLIAGCLLMTVVMLLWNYIIVPIYMGMPRAAVAAMLVPAFLPFNLLKGGLNAAITMILYKPVSTALRLSKLYQAESTSTQVKGKINVGVLLASCFIIISAVLIILIMQGRI